MVTGKEPEDGHTCVVVVNLLMMVCCEHGAPQMASFKTGGSGTAGYELAGLDLGMGEEGW